MPRRKKQSLFLKTLWIFPRKRLEIYFFVCFSKIKSKCTSSKKFQVTTTRICITMNYYILCTLDFFQVHIYNLFHRFLFAVQRCPIISYLKNLELTQFGFFWRYKDVTLYPDLIISSLKSLELTQFGLENMWWLWKHQGLPL